MEHNSAADTVKLGVETAQAQQFQARQVILDRIHAQQEKLKELQIELGGINAKIEKNEKLTDKS